MTTLSKDMEHILEEVFALPANSPLHKVLIYNGYGEPLDFTTEPDETLEELDYPDNAGAQAKITKESAGLFKSLKHFVAHQSSQGIKYCENYWTRVTQAQFNAVRTANGFDPIPIVAMSVKDSALMDLMELSDQMDTISCQADIVSGNTVPIVALLVLLMHVHPLPKLDIVKELKQ